MSPTVLVVDDSLTVRMELCELLEGAGFVVVPCETLAAAREALSGRRIDLVVLDVQLPDGDGVELLRELRADASPWSAVPVLMLSAEAEVRDRLRALRTGADDYVGKPYDAGFLVSRARALTAGAGPEERDAPTVLLVDDSPGFRAHLKDALEAAGYRALAAGSGEEGLRTISAAAPDAVVIDGQLPDLDGAEVVARLKREDGSRRIPYVVLTPSSPDQRAGDPSALETGADASIRKTADTAVILARVTALLRGDAAAAQGSPGGPVPRRVLAIDGDRAAVEPLARHLRGDGYDVAFAASGEEALELLAAQPVDAIVLDLTLHGLSGLDLLGRLKSSPAWRDIPVLVVTAREEAMLEALHAGADDFVTKAVDLEVVAARLRAQVRRRRYEEEDQRIRDELLQREVELQRAHASRAAAEERARESLELQRRQAELVAFFKLSPDLVCLCSPEGELRRVSASWTAALGYAPEDLEGMSLMALVHPDDRERTRATFEALRRGDPVSEFENRLVSSDGAQRWLRWWASADRERGQVCAAARDVTRQRAMEQALRDQAHELRLQTEELLTQQTELQRANAELERASRFKSSFLASMSHELRTPLNAVIGFSELMLEDAGAPLAQEHRRHAEHILASGRHLLSLISDVLDLARIEAGRLVLKPEPVQAASAIREALAVVAASAGKRQLSFRTDVRAARHVLADPLRLRQVLLNLLANAIKFSPEGGEIEVGAADGEVGEVRLWVRDRGHGIAPELLPQLFQPFVQGEDALTRRHEGTGLGLAISHRLVDEHGGRLEVESVVGEGATFTFTLPAASASAKEVAPPSTRYVVASPPAGDAVRPRVLVAASHAVTAGRLRAWLGDAGYVVLEATNAAEAHALATRHEPAAVVAVVDGGVIGGGLVEALGAEGRTVLVVSSLDPDDVVTRHGAADWLIEPVDRAELVTRLSPHAPPPPPRQGRVVVSIDDDPRVGLLLRSTLEGRGYDLLSAHAGREGLELVRRSRPALAVVDLALPDMSGVEVVEALAADAETSQVPIVVLSGVDLGARTAERLRPHVRAIARKGDLSRDDLLALVERATAAPRRQGPMASERFAAPRPGALPGRQVLVVDDNDVNRELVRTILEGVEVDVLVAASADDGVALARSARPALVLMDLAMPGRDGFSAVRELKSDPETADIPVVALTAMAMRSDELRAREAGFDGYLTKPIERRALIRVVRVFVDGERA